MKNRLATYITSIILAMVMILSSGFEVCAESYDSEIEIELSENFSQVSIQENVGQSQMVEDEQNAESFSNARKFNCSRKISCINIIPVDRQKVFCNFRE